MLHKSCAVTFPSFALRSNSSMNCARVSTKREREREREKFLFVLFLENACTDFKQKMPPNVKEDMQMSSREA